MTYVRAELLKSVEFSETPKVYLSYKVPLCVWQNPRTGQPRKLDLTPATAMTDLDFSLPPDVSIYFTTPCFASCNLSIMIQLRKYA